MRTKKAFSLQLFDAHNHHECCTFETRSPDGGLDTSVECDTNAPHFGTQFRTARENEQGSRSHTKAFFLTEMLSSLVFSGDVDNHLFLVTSVRVEVCGRTSKGATDELKISIKIRNTENSLEKIGSQKVKG